MRRLVLCIIVLLALFAIIRAYTQQAATAKAGTPTHGVKLSPGLVEVSEGQGTVSLAFGLMGSGDEGKWNVLPLKVVYTSGDRSVSLGLNGLSFLVAGGVRIGKPVVVDRATSGDVVSIGGKITVNNRIDGDVWAFAADIALGAKADVTGNVVSIGGKVTVDPRATVGGAIHTLPQLKLPYISVLATKASVPAVELIRELLGFLLAAFVLFLAAYFMGPQIAGISRAVEAEWRRALVSLLLSLVTVPLVVVLLVVSIFGIFFLPFLFLAVIVAAFAGLFGVVVRIGAWLRRGSQDTSLFLFTSGLLGLFLIKLPAFAGILLGLVRSDIAGKVGDVLRVVSLGLSLALLAYGLGSCLSYMRVAASARRG